MQILLLKLALIYKIKAVSCCFRLKYGSLPSSDETQVHGLRNGHRR